MAVDLYRLLQLVLDKKSRELKVGVGLPPWILIRKDWRPLNLPVLTSLDVSTILTRIAPPPALQAYQEKGTCEFGLPFQAKAHFFVTVTTDEGKCTLRIQHVPKKQRDVSEQDAGP